jgi:uroporphyrinogen-III synthase
MSRKPRVLVTRAAHQASALADALAALGAEPVVVPAIEILELASYAVLDEAMKDLSAFDWVVFTSANAVEAFWRRLSETGSALGALRFAVIGAATERELVKHGAAAEVLAPQAVAESLAEVLLPFARRSGGDAGRFLLVRAEQARDALPEALRAAGAEVTIAPAYRTVRPEASIAAVRELFGTRENWPDAVTFTSSSSVTNLLELVECAGVRLPEAVLRASIGPITSRTLAEAGFLAHVEAAEASVESLAKVVMGALGGR